MRAFWCSRSRGEPTQAVALDGADLRTQEVEPLKQAVQLGAGVVRQRRSLRYADRDEPVDCIAQAQAEAANAEAGENRLDVVDEASR
ncbi:MAG: hypothetical protein EOS63_28640 [Mesorhizobium sp.]|uniref:hypothetical protein n=1 Tax=Mesorhizobium sp. TaxID=1871066 RepID=UPI000FE54225|nr:hypothetical protein [Mesorhizobium sp.]RWE73257.1 MAG: hypothetical protein EOS63_28640 [Mesorhizobium sp.]TJW58686.1 MAG: hypothetical protein E5V97_31230 [Mesorhizobium sp.]